MHLSMKRKPQNTEKVKKEKTYFGTELKGKKTKELSVLMI